MANRKTWTELADEVRSRPGAAEEIAARTEAILDSLRLAELREQRQKTQVELAKMLGKTQAGVSRIERSRNLYLSTLAEYVEGLGGHVEINAVFDDDVIPLAEVPKTKREPVAG